MLCKHNFLLLTASAAYSLILTLNFSSHPPSPLEHVWQPAIVYLSYRIICWYILYANYTTTAKSAAKCASITSIRVLPGWVCIILVLAFPHTHPQALTQAQTVWEALLRQRRAAGLMAVLTVTCQAMYYGNCISSRSHITPLFFQVRCGS